jgi:hypothetical protein
VRAPDYRALLRELSEKLAQLRSEAEIADAVETAARQSLELKAAQLVTLENLSRRAFPHPLGRTCMGPSRIG